MTTVSISQNHVDMWTRVPQLNRIQGLRCPHTSKTAIFDVDTFHNSHIFRKLAGITLMVSTLACGQLEPLKASELSQVPSSEPFTLKAGKLQTDIFNDSQLHIQPLKLEIKPIKSGSLAPYSSSIANEYPTVAKTTLRDRCHKAGQAVKHFSKEVTKATYKTTKWVCIKTEPIIRWLAYLSQCIAPWY